MSEKSYTTTFHVKGMCCVDEEILIKKKLQALSGIERSTFNLVSEKLSVVHTCPKEEIVNSLHEAGFSARTDDTREAPQSFWEKNSSLLSTSVSGFFLILGMIASQFAHAGSMNILFFVASILSGGWKIGSRAMYAAKSFSLDMNFLMTIATIGAGVIGHWAEAAAVIFLFSVALLLESYSMERTRRSIRSLLGLSPTHANVLLNHRTVSIPLDQVNIGDIIMIAPGERVPLDGVVNHGYSAVNQSAITGESQLIEKAVGDIVYAGSLNARGNFEMRVTKLVPETLLSRITQMVEDAQIHRAPSQTFIDRFASWYTPMMIGTAVLIASIPPLFLNLPFTDWFYRALTLLVIACPCALVISTPITIVSGLTSAARRGVLIKGGRHLEEIGRIDAFAFDKTGTLTDGSLRVTDIVALNSVSDVEVLRLTAAIEAKSEHHLADAILKKVEEENIDVHEVIIERFEAIAGKGIEATVGGTSYVVGNHAFIEERRICTPEIERLLYQLEGEGKTAIILGTDREALGIIALADTVRAETVKAVQGLQAEGVKKIVMITGDNEGTASAIAQKTQIDEFYAAVLPGEKVRQIKRLKERFGKVAMVGDGINDAPALAASDLGIAMGTAGTDTTLETADIVLMSDDLSRLGYLMKLSKKSVAVIRQNIAIALLTKLVFILLALTGSATLWMAILADDGAALVVILNGLRMLRFRS